MRHTTHSVGTVPRRGALLIAAIALTLSACGGDEASGAEDTSPSAPATVVSSTLPLTDLPVETTATVAETVVTTPATLPADLSDPTAKGAATTVAPTTIPVTTVPAASLPVPVPVPPDSRGQEPVIDLGTIEIPKIGVNETMYEGIRLTTLDRGPGHWPGTAMPGQIGNSVIAGHRVSHGKTFRNVDKLVAGDQVIFNTADGRFVYEVLSLEIVTPDAIRIIDQTADKTATLFACHPPGSTRERIVVHLAFVEG